MDPLHRGFALGGEGALLGLAGSTGPVWPEVAATGWRTLQGGLEPRGVGVVAVWIRFLGGAPGGRLGSGAWRSLGIVAIPGGGVREPVSEGRRERASE